MASSSGRNRTELSVCLDSNWQVPKVGKHGTTGVVGRGDNTFHQTYGLGKFRASLHQTACKRKRNGDVNHSFGVSGEMYTFAAGEGGRCVMGSPHQQLPSPSVNCNICFCHQVHANNAVNLQSFDKHEFMGEGFIVDSKLHTVSTACFKQLAVCCTKFY